MNYKAFCLVLLVVSGCRSGAREQKTSEDTGSQKIRFVSLDPGHFHAALIHKTMYGSVDSTFQVYAPEGPELTEFLKRVEAYNNREEVPTRWNIEPVVCEDYLQRMLTEKRGNVMVVAGKNSKKIDYVLEAVKAGMHVYADKPLVIDPDGFEKLKKAFQIAETNGVLLYDMMTERFEATTMMQKLFSELPEVFGELVDGTMEEPAISKESVHHFFKDVSGRPLVRPPWFFDVNQEGEGTVDVTTHLVDLVQWEAFPDQIIDTAQIQMLSAKRWPTKMTQWEFQKVTGLEKFPDFLRKDITNDDLYVYCNSELNYRINGKHAKVSVKWNYKAPQGAGDTHYSIMRGTKSNLIIKQGPEEHYRPTLYIESKTDSNFPLQLANALENDIAIQFPGSSFEKMAEGLWKINIPVRFRLGHEAHFAKVTGNYLGYLKEGALPSWEVPNMIAKYYTTIEAYKMVRNH
ncbi:Gfo/Idh/MocA family oxidoreductase [Flavobacteriaceae bacterium TP-CH-4]|uniref:Gfo/Idh/MocA family oxidoreductase n=1 Tax=Pelagihabitans pacificus TaxID=2696054 RepID=A0A967E829_9FLAO|nr:putative oxidoreductase C-terminal domain-containing protein [Pelagihabitans pacificus]NHF61230.1 Gfo/Idh/MocA family oxidoreductase [Pelagihabitans pacificus]